MLALLDYTTDRRACLEGLDIKRYLDSDNAIDSIVRNFDGPIATHAVTQLIWFHLNMWKADPCFGRVGANGELWPRPTRLTRLPFSVHNTRQFQPLDTLFCKITDAILALKGEKPAQPPLWLAVS